MQDTYSNDQLQAYGKRLAARLCDQYFSAQPVGTTLDGPAVLRLAPVRQLNLYVVQQLLSQWTQEMGRLRSPYFDYEDPAVRHALTQLMNLLSRRIRLSRDGYEPLLAQAAADTLLTALDPLAAFGEKLLPAGQATATPAQLRDALRYVDVNKPLFQGFIDSLPDELPQEREFLLSRFRPYRDAHYKEQQPLSSLLDELTPIVAVTEQELRRAETPVATTTTTAPSLPTKPAPAPEAPVAAPAAETLPAAPEPEVRPAPASTPAPAIAVAEPESPAATAPAALPVAAPNPAPAASAPAAVAEPMASPQPEIAPPQPAEPVAPVATPTERPRPLAEAAPPTNTLAEKLAAGVRTSTLAEKLASSNGGSAPSTLAEAQPKVESLRSAISINQRFSFINELFNGENMEYHSAIEHLDAQPTAEAARRYITEDLAQRYQWVRKDEHVNKLLRLIDRKFA